LPEAEAERLERRDGLTFFEPVGCPECNGTGYKGRMAVYEVLVPGDRVRRALLSGADVATLQEAAVAEGMRTLLQAGLDAAAAGLTTVQEAIRITPGPR
jgi:general secretion pathway protein E